MNLYPLAWCSCAPNVSWLVGEGWEEEDKTPIQNDSDQSCCDAEVLIKVNVLLGTGLFFLFICAMVKSRYIGDGHPTFNGNPYNGYINPYYWVDDHPLLYGNNESLDPGTFGSFLVSFLSSPFQD